MDEKIINAFRAANARVSALKSVGRDDDYITKSLLTMPGLPEEAKSIIKNARAEGKSSKVIQDITALPVKDSIIEKEELETGGALGKVSKFLGIEKAGRRIGTTLAQLSPEHRRNLEMLNEEDANTLKTGGVSGKEFAGSVANVGLTVLGGSVGTKILSNVSKTMRGARILGQPVAGQAFSTSKRALASGIGTGYASDVAQGFTENMDTADALKPGIGTIVGTIAGSIPGIQGLMRTRAGKKTQEAFESVIDVVSPKLKGKAGDRSLVAGKARVSEPGLFKSGDVSFARDPDTVKIAQATEDIVNPKKSLAYNFNTIQDKIEDVAENQVRPFLAENKVPFNFEDFRGRLSLVEPASSLKNDAGAFQNYGRVREEILGDVASFLKSKGDLDNGVIDLNNLWDARKILDNKIYDELGASTFGTPQYTGVKAAAKDMRRAFSSYITDSLTNPGQAEELNRFYEFLNVAKSRGISISKEGDAIKLLKQQMGIQDIPENVAKGAFYKFQMDQMNLMYEALENMAPKVRGEAGKTGYELWAKRNPKLAKVAALGAIGGASALGIRTLGGGSPTE